MSLQTTPRRLAPPRSSHTLTSVASSPALSLSQSQSTAVARKASLNALVGKPTTPTSTMGADSSELEVGDLVDVPGAMTGVVKFVGSVRGKPGVFAGVELSRQFATRGKNDGDVEGTSYFRTSVPGSGIFLPIHRAKKRATSGSDLSPTPTTPSYGSKFSASARERPNFSASMRGKPDFSASTRQRPEHSPETPSIPKFSQSLGPGARAPSPQFKQPGRPSLPRPESPFRKQPNLAPTPSRAGSITPSGFSKSAIGPPRFNSPGPRTAAFQKPRTPGPPRPYSRNNSRLGHHDIIDEDAETTPTANRVSNSTASSKGRRPGSSQSDEEVTRLSKLLEERDKQLKEQAASLAEMESSLAEIQSMLPEDGMSFGSSRNSGEESGDVTQLRSLLREKNEKIAMLTAEFDAHRADFRSTIDTLEMASTETERVYERKVEELQEELRELHSRGEDVATVAMQLKQLEELVQELEEGLEDARRGEAEARGEVEFLRGEVERGRSELRREREKAAAALKGAGAMVDSPATPGTRDLEQRDDEIRGLKAIIHSLSSGPAEEQKRSPLSRQGSSVNPEELRSANARVETVEREKEELRGLVERKAFREEELEREIERLKEQLSANAQRESIVSNGLSEHTAKDEKRSSGRDSKGTVVSWRGSPQATRRDAPPALEPMTESADGLSSVDGDNMWCGFCEESGHDILNCPAMGGSEVPKPLAGARNGKDAVIEGLRNLSVSSDRQRSSAVTPTKVPGNAPSGDLPPPPPLFTASSPSPGVSLVPPKGESAPDPDKWCALCESEGHDVTACPNEDAF
ncbi:uncharacterized protein CC84DRAFT_1162819 [Paraphaeosphaeria sporulosa]|uniref:CAP-Gly domain-containing protein n=1 Tax=Paraphaeosphaeria sporulosa TaxID=1460663 RepID=A0A177CP10_9PLEO|nr:uncharacterized protein CC84DRAFT_1162819 [Paraphaeosphaeria sporulosa]OAG09026.1 hypothetical protein CC84DRAFT_1162819 [Paraphaeosphaeria sporulosa]